MLRQVKDSALRLANRAGLPGIIANSAWRGRRLLILCYHSIARTDEHQWRPTLFFPADAFRRRLEILRELDATVMSLPEALRHVQRGTLPHRAVALTFDDGSVDFHSVAAPLLREFDFPATVYLSTYYVDNQWPVFDLMFDYLLWRARSTSVGIWPKLPGSVALDDPASRRIAFDSIRRQAAQQRLNGAALHELTEEAAAWYSIDFASLCRARKFCLMTADEVADISAGGCDVELHTHRHQLPPSRDEFLAELDENRARITAYTGKEPSHFCYPSGAYTLNHVRWLSDTVVQSATTCDPGLTNILSERLLLPRFVDTPLIAESNFRAWISGLGHMLSRRTRHDASVYAQLTS